MSANLVRLTHLHPTQLTVGMREVKQKRQELQGLLPHDKQVRRFLEAHAIPAVLGVEGHHFIIDHHHLARALWEVELEHAPVTIVRDLSDLGDEAFWAAMTANSWLHPMDANGLRRPDSALPKHVKDLEDDPFRSLAGAVREAGGFAKTEAPFAEFAWADFFRTRVPRATVTEHFAKAVALATAFARSPEARGLPGAEQDHSGRA